MMLTNRFETLQEIAERTGEPAEIVIDYVKTEYQEKRAVCRFNTGDGIEFKKAE